VRNAGVGCASCAFLGRVFCADRELAQGGGVFQGHRWAARPARQTTFLVFLAFHSAYDYYGLYSIQEKK